MYLNEELLQRFIKLIAVHTGWYIRQQDWNSLSQKLQNRIKLLKITNPESYYQLLEADMEQSHQEWRQLAVLLTTTETYFFRDQGQFSLLRNQILPDLIDRKRKQRYSSNEVKPSLRLWSAGCSTGEEPYSLAILIKELLPEWETWDILILGTDINLETIAKARQGIYSSWSFRMVDPSLQGRYFQIWKGDWKIDETIRRMVKFQDGNLVKDPFPNKLSDIHEMDLIICRNVFVYFDNQAIASVIQKFAHTLSPIGYLITGHAELYGQNLGFLQSKVFPESVVYQKRSQIISTDLPGAKISPQTTQPVAACPVNPTSRPRFNFNKSNIIPQVPEPAPKVEVLNQRKTKDKSLSKNQHNQIFREAETLFKKKDYSQAISKAQQVLSLDKSHFGAYYLLAQVYANLGDYTKARNYCHQALSVDSLAVSPYYLLAHIAEEQGEMESAKALLKKIIYITPSAVAAYLELGSIYEKEGNVTRTLKMRTVALETLRKLPATAIIEQKGAITVAELIPQIEKILSNPQ